MSEHTIRERKVWTRGIILLGMVAAVMMAAWLPACSHGLAASYRAHGVLTVTIKAADKAVAETQKPKEANCDETYSTDKPALLACLKKVREPVKLWVDVIKPAIVTAGAAFWLALETAYALESKSLSKTDKAVMVACAALVAAEKSVTQYKDKIGAMAVPLLGAIGTGKLLVCDGS